MIIMVKSQRYRRRAHREKKSTRYNCLDIISTIGVSQFVKIIDGFSVCQNAQCCVECDYNSVVEC